MPNLNPVSRVSALILPATGTYANVVPALPINAYVNSVSFITGAYDQVAYTYKMLGGDVLDIELTAGMVYAAYQVGVLAYSSIVNLHQAKNTLASFLGSETGTFNSSGQFISGSNLSGGVNASLSYPQFTFAYARRISDAISYEIGLGGNTTYYSASVTVIDGVQDYDLQSVVSSSAVTGGVEYAAVVNASNGAKIRIAKVFFRSPAASWRFFGFYSGLGSAGNLQSFGQYADDSSFEAVPAWQNILQASAYETNLRVRAAHYSYELRNNKLRIMPVPTSATQRKIWFLFSLDPDATDEDSALRIGLSGVNNFNTLPFENVPFENINSIGKDWIRRYGLAVAKGMLALNRGKYQSIPIPGGEVTLNYAALEAQSKEEIEKLREELKTELAELTYSKLAERTAQDVENAVKAKSFMPKSIFCF